MKKKVSKGAAAWRCWGRLHRQLFEPTFSKGEDSHMNFVREKISKQGKKIWEKNGMNNGAVQGAAMSSVLLKGKVRNWQGR